MRTRNRMCVSLSCILFVMVIHQATLISASSLKTRYYKKSCPKAESIVSKIVHEAVSEDKGLGAGLIRLLLHDCFVRGCDASILLDPTPFNLEPEKLSPVNNPSIEGFDLIDTAKTALEEVCPGVVSCADIIAFAARDASYVLGGIKYHMPSGRRDGDVSLSAEVKQNLPDPSFNLTQLKANFKSKGLSTKDLVVLSGAHSIGDSHCSSFSKRLYPMIDPNMNLGFAYYLMYKCPRDAAANVTVSQDLVTPDVLDNQYYKNVQARKALFFSDWSLLTSPKTSKLVNDYATIPGLWESKFKKSMRKLASVGVLTGKMGEVRKSCRAVN